MKILYLEDDETLSQTVEEILQKEGYEVIVAYSASEALNLSYNTHYDLFIFDVNLPDMNGFTLLEMLREAGVETATIFTTSLENLENISEAYRVGADDYIKKPFFIDELLFRIKAVLKREFHSAKDRVILTKHSIFNLNTNEIIYKDQTISLNPKEATLLKLLLKYIDECVSFETIYQTLWAFNTEYSEKSLRTYIKKLRQYISKEHIVSIKKVGYKFIKL